jgi:FdhD protein
MSAVERREVWRWRRGEPAAPGDDDLAAESPLEIRVNGHPLSVTMRTPGEDAELAVGFLLSEGMIKGRADVRTVAPLTADADCNVIGVELAPHVQLDFDRLTRHVFASSSCGLCGLATIEAVHHNFPPLDADSIVDAETLLLLPERCRAAQAVFGRTGGLHAAALFDGDGELLVLREDVGRHNALDKVLGEALLEDRLPLDELILLVSGRASFEIMQKALAGRIPIVCAVSAPSSLAVEFAAASHQTLVGFLRGSRMNVYAGRQRVRFR